MEREGGEVAKMGERKREKNDTEIGLAGSNYFLEQIIMMMICKRNFC
jgi:hypothetical protein